MWDAYLKVRTNAGAAGIDGQSLEQFEQDRNNNLYKLWNRLSSGSYFPPPVKLVEVPKPDGGVRPLGAAALFGRSKFLGSCHRGRSFLRLHWPVAGLAMVMHGPPAVIVGPIRRDPRCEIGEMPFGMMANRHPSTRTHRLTRGQGHRQTAGGR